MAIDVLINVLFKPLQTAAALLSLLEHSGAHVDRIYFHEENKNPPEMHARIRQVLADRIEHFVLPEYINWHEPVDPARLGEERYRHSIRYQWGWERSDKDFVLVMHNDVLFTGDAVGAMLEAAGEYLAVGNVGNCAPCPAGNARVCTPATYLDFRPSHAYLMRLYGRMAPGRNVHPYNEDFPPEFQKQPWPLPHCRVNEWCMLVNLKRAREMTAPLGPAMPLGAMASCGRHILDTGARWFRDVSLAGAACLHFPVEKYMRHTYGHQAMLDEDRYLADEAAALKVLNRDYRERYF